MKASALIGKIAFIKEFNGSQWNGHWGVIKHFDGRYYHIGGGSLGDGINPVFTRDEFTVRRPKKGQSQ